MKQTCGSVREWLGVFADGELDPERTEQVRAHLETCAGCRRELDQIQELHKLMKSVEHPRLAEDYWDWHRTKVWHGIRNRKRASTPSYRPSFAWPKLTAAAAGLVVVLVVVIAGWRTFLPKQGLIRPVGYLASEPGRAAPQPVAATPGARRSMESEEADEAAGGTSAEVKGRWDELAQVPKTAARDAEKVSVGYAAKRAEATGVTSASKPSTTPASGIVSRMEVAAEEHREELSGTASAGAQHVRASSGEGKSRMVSGPVLLESPPLADADALDTGTVFLNVKTDSAGRVLSAGVRRSSGSPRLDSVAVRQIRQSRFKAAVKNNRSVPSSFDYPYRFLKKQAKPQEQQRPQEGQKQREEHKLQQEQDQQNEPVQNDKSEKPDTDKQDAPLKEKTTK
jgi:TonB family protein